MIINGSLMKINVKKKCEAQKYGIFGQIACVRPLLALASDKVERGDACLRCFHILNFS